MHQRRSTPRRPVLSAAVAVVLACTLAACGSDDDAGTTTSPSVETVATSDVPATTASSDTTAATTEDTTGDTTAATSGDTTGDTTAATTGDTSAGTIPMATAPEDGGASTATMTYQGETYEFTTGGCSSSLDPNQFVFRDPAAPGIDATYFAIAVSDLDEPATSGGSYLGAVTYQRDGKFVVTANDITLVVADDLRSGTFSGTEYFSGDPVDGSWTC